LATMEDFKIVRLALLVCMLMNGCVVDCDPISKEYVLDALKCDDVRTSAAYSGRKFCNKQIIENDYEVGARAPSGKYSVVQFSPNRKIKGVRCVKKVSTITAICGAFSHSKLVTPPDVLVPVAMTARECMEATQTHFITTEDQRQLRVPMGTQVTYKYISTGSVTLSESNVACEGGEMSVLGKKHDNIVKLVTVNLLVEEIDVFESKGRLKTEEGLLPRQCSLAFEGCTLDDMTLIIDLNKVNLCQYKSIRAARFDAISWQGKSLLINDEHKILVAVKDKIPIPSECVLRGNLIKTNFERIFLIQGDIDQEIDMIDPTSLDLELETRVTDFYLSYWTMTLFREGEVKWQEELCQLTADKMTDERVVLHDDHVMKLQGELVIEFPCSKVKVRTREGHKFDGDLCFDHLPVYLPDNKVGFLTPLTRVIVPRNSVSVVNCSAHYPIIYETNEGKMITANPSVQEVEVSVSDYHHLNANSVNHSELFEFSSLLYTPEEIRMYESMLTGHNSERVINKKFAAYYCQVTGECTPSRISNDFQWEKMLNPEEVMSYYYEKIKDYLVWWAIVWSICDGILTLIQIGIKCLIVGKNFGRKELTGGALFRFVFLPGPELVNLFPQRNRLDDHDDDEDRDQCRIEGCGSHEMSELNRATV